VTSATTAPAIVAGTGTAQAISCANPVVVIAPTFTPSTANLTYTWTGSGIVGSANNPSVSVNQSGLYTLIVTNTLTGCSSGSISVPISGSSVPPTVTVVSSSSIGIGCTPTTSMITLTANTTPTSGVNYNWSNATTTQTTSITSAGVYTLVVTDATTGCSVTTQYTVTNSSIAPNANAGANGSLPCGAGATFTLGGSSTSTGVTYTWTGVGIVSGANTPSPTVNQAGIFTLTVSNPTTGCSSSATVAVAATTVVASFTADVTSGVTPLTVNLTNTSSGAISYNWNFGNGSTSTQTNTSVTYNANGSYMIVLTASSGACTNTTSLDITVNEGLTLEIPNVFTPNDDGVNDVFTITSTGVKEISLQIFNRWGQMMYEFTGAKAGWDGVTSSGVKVSEGTYFYFVKAKGFDDKEISKNGAVSLFR
jgi:gliding motility-associated-like protein